MACSNHEIFHCRDRDSGEPSRSSASSLLRHCGAVLGTWMARVRQRRALRKLDDRLLADVGLTRADARRECAKPFWIASRLTEQVRPFPGRRRLAAAVLLIRGR